jgi:peptidoglycan/xylan/chitin deacetylase (PgdA/CDA1 family)
VRFVAAAVVVCALFGAANEARAKVWPQPALGPSRSGDPEVIFTFDDGPDLVRTPVVLDLLAKYHIHAIFFLVGKQVSDPSPKAKEIIERILREGHIIGNHTKSHKDLCLEKNRDLVDSEIDEGRAAIVNLVHVEPVFFRAPFGSRCDVLEEALEKRQLKHFHWDLDPQEWKGGGTARTINYVTKQLGAATGRDVLLLHDVKLITVRALPTIFEWLVTENERRISVGQRPIRVIQAPDVALEMLSPGLAAWAGSTLNRIAEVRSDLARVLP